MVLHIESRKVQKTGGSTFIISLPIDWVKRHNIDKNYKGYTLGLISQPDGNLMITPNPKSEEIVKVKEFDVDNIKDYNFLFRLLVGAYIMGYTKIILTSSRRYEPFIRDCIVSFTKTAIGMEIIEETNQKIVVKDLLNPKEMPFEHTIKRMYILVESMHEDSIEALTTQDKILAEEVIKRDDEVDRLHWLIGRQSHIALKDILLCQKMGVSLEDAIQYQQFSRLLERIGDHAVKIAKNVIKLLDKKIDPILVEEISSASELAIKTVLISSLDAWLQKDIALANKNIDGVKELVKLCETIIFEPNNNDIDTSIPIGYIVESIRRAGEYAGDICEVIINSLINR
jgi:phosphate uptake regulator